MTSILAGLAGPLPVEVSFKATVTTSAHEFIGARTHATHETFDAKTDDGVHVRIVDNIDLAPRIPVVRGDRIAVRGELVTDRSGAPVVHWTHHDPASRHVDGWIDWRGRRYA